MSSLAIPLPDNLYVGLKLVPLHPGHIGNAVITEITEDRFIIVTDFGKEVRFTNEELRSLFSATTMQVENEYFMDLIHEPVDYDKELRKRFETQRELIQQQLDKLKQPTS
ncbi:DUF2110 family protein [Alteromonas sp. BMJM2]|uniref:DUF2110 family protein n=1 Tax=Alteromonas sp. BMJM2 TaxID=2954241 RepID=UPI003FA45371